MVLFHLAVIRQNQIQISLSLSVCVCESVFADDFMSHATLQISRETFDMGIIVGLEVVVCECVRFFYFMACPFHDVVIVGRFVVWFVYWFFAVRWPKESELRHKSLMQPT